MYSLVFLCGKSNIQGIICEDCRKAITIDIPSKTEKGKMILFCPRCGQKIEIE